MERRCRQRFSDQSRGLPAKEPEFEVASASAGATADTGEDREGVSVAAGHEHLGTATGRRIRQQTGPEKCLGPASGGPTIASPAKVNEADVRSRHCEFRAANLRRVRDLRRER
jgi:hypothetical protein